MSDGASVHKQFVCLRRLLLRVLDDGGHLSLFTYSIDVQLGRLRGPDYEAAFKIGVNASLNGNV